MSIETWELEFYDEGVVLEASGYNLKATELSNDTIIRFIDQCIKKWEGVLEENLDKHELKKWDEVSWIIYDKSSITFSFKSPTCSLCAAFLECTGNGCSECPIYKVSGRDCEAEWLEWTNNDNPQQMIELLHKTKQCYLEQKS